MAIVPLAYPNLPADSEMNSARPVFGSTVGKLASIANHLAGYRFRRHVCATVESTNAASLSLPADSAGHNHTVRLRFPLSPLAKHLFVSFDYGAKDKGTTVPSVVLSAWATSGVMIDRGCEFRRDNATLPCESATFAVVAGAYFVGNPMLRIDTTTRTDDAAAAAAGPTLPRMLYVEPNASQAIEVRLVVTEARVVSVSAFEFWEAEV